MSEKLNVTHTVDGLNAKITVDVSPDEMISSEASAALSEGLVKGYNEAVKENPSVRNCVVEIKAEVAGSPLIRGLFELYKTVRARKGEVVCAGFPNDYISSLTSVGLLDQPGFSVRATVEEAVRKLEASKA